MARAAWLLVAWALFCSGNLGIFWVMAHYQPSPLSILAVLHLIVITGGVAAFCSIRGLGQ